LPWRPIGFALLDGHASAVHQDVEEGNLGADLQEQLQLDGAIYFFLIALRNVGSHRFGVRSTAFIVTTKPASSL